MRSPTSVACEEQSAAEASSSKSSTKRRRHRNSVETRPRSVHTDPKPPQHAPWKKNPRSGNSRRSNSGRQRERNCFQGKERELPAVPASLEDEKSGEKTTRNLLDEESPPPLVPACLDDSLNIPVK